MGRATYPELFAAIGTTFGNGDGVTTFNVPNMIGRHAKGSLNVGEYIEPGLPNITGTFTAKAASGNAPAGAFYGIGNMRGGSSDSSAPNYEEFGYNASQSNPIYGTSDTVDVAAVGLLPCIKAFDAATNPGLIDITELANEMASKTDATAAAHAAMPSNQYVNLTLGPNESRYTAPADGYFSYFAIADRDWGDMSFVNASGFSSCIGRAPVTGGIRCSIPCKKSDQIIVFYEGSPNVQHFRFYYCKGSKP